MLISYCSISEFKSRSPTFSEDSGKPASSLLDPHQGQFFTTVQLRKKPGESLGIILTAGKFKHLRKYYLKTILKSLIRQYLTKVYNEKYLYNFFMAPELFL